MVVINFNAAMKTVHVYLSDEMYARFRYFIESEGFKGPSEFVRFMIKYFEYLPPTPKRTVMERFRGNRPYEPASRPAYFDFFPQRVIPGTNQGIPYSPDPSDSPNFQPPPDDSPTQHANPPTPS